MASGLALVATAVGEVPKVVVDGRTGLLARHWTRGRWRREFWSYCTIPKSENGWDARHDN